MYLSQSIFNWAKTIAFCSAIGLLQSCGDSGGSKDIPDPEESEADHTLLIYIIGDNSLSKYAETNISSASQGLLSATKPLNLVIYKDNESGNPVLFRLKLSDNRQSVSRDTLMVWDTDVKSTAPDQLAYVVDYVFNQKYPTTVKGLEMWSHGDSWIPGGYTYTIASSSSARPSPLTYIGVDGTSYLEIWDMSSALSSAGVKFDYIFFDACFMATAEVAYELRDNTDYIAGSLCEIMGQGLPYLTFIPSLAESQTTSGVESALRELVDDFEAVYGPEGEYKNNGGTFSVIRTSAMEKLRNAWLSVRDGNADRLNSLYNDAASLRFTLQRYGRKLQTDNDRTAFYHDMGSVMKYIDSNNSGALQILQEEAVVKEFHSEYFRQGSFSDNHFDLSDVSGMCITVPEFLHLYSNADKFIKAYGKCAWGKDLK